MAAGCRVRDPGPVGSGRVLGVDACKRGWIAIAVEDGVTDAYFAEDIQTLTSRAQADGPLGVVAVDMPIGLPDRGQRRADVLARAAIGPLRSSVFMAPVREALMAADHAAASAINRGLSGQGISIQAFGLKPKLFQVERWVRHMPIRVVEIHPEVCFARLAGCSLTSRKSSWAGAEYRRALLLGGAAGPARPRSADPQPTRNLQRRLGMRHLGMTDLTAADEVDAAPPRRLILMRAANPRYRQ